MQALSERGLISQQDKQLLKDAIELCRTVIGKYPFHGDGMPEVHAALSRAESAVGALRTGRRV